VVWFKRSLQGFCKLQVIFLSKRACSSYCKKDLDIWWDAEGKDADPPVQLAVQLPATSGQPESQRYHK